MATERIRYVRTSADAAGDGTTDTDSSGDGTHAYQSLALGESGEQGNLVTADEWLHFICSVGSGTAADSTACTFSGHTTDATRYILIEAASGDVSVKSGLDTSKYRLTNDLLFSDVNIYVDGIQFANSLSYTEMIKARFAGTGFIVIRNCYIYAADLAGLECIEIDDANVDFEMYNNVLYGANNRDFGVYILNANSALIYNNIIVGMTDGILIAANGNSVTVKNNASFGNTDDIDDADTSTIDYNASDDGDGTNAVSPSGADWANEYAGYATGDFTITAGGNCIAGGVGPGTDANVPSTDMEGDTRSGATCAIGVDEPTGGAGVVVPVFYDYYAMMRR